MLFESFGQALVGHPGELAQDSLADFCHMECLHPQSNFKSLGADDAGGVVEIIKFLFSNDVLESSEDFHKGAV